MLELILITAMNIGLLYKDWKIIKSGERDSMLLYGAVAALKATVAAVTLRIFDILFLLTVSRSFLTLYYPLSSFIDFSTHVP